MGYCIYAAGLTKWDFYQNEKKQRVWKKRCISFSFFCNATWCHSVGFCIRQSHACKRTFLVKVKENYSKSVTVKVETVKFLVLHNSVCEYHNSFWHVLASKKLHITQKSVLQIRQLYLKQNTPTSTAPCIVLTMHRCITTTLWMEFYANTTLDRMVFFTRNLNKLLLGAMIVH